MKFHFQFEHTVIIIIPKNICNTPMVVVYYNTKLLSPHLKNRIKQIVHLSLSSVPWSIRPLTTHDVFIFKVRFLAASHMVRGDVIPVFSITWLRKRSLCPPLAFFPWTLPARMRPSGSPFRMMWPVKRVCLSLRDKLFINATDVVRTLLNYHNNDYQVKLLNLSPR